jgi:hypothetical protein
MCFPLPSFLRPPIESSGLNKKSLAQFGYAVEITQLCRHIIVGRLRVLKLLEPRRSDGPGTIGNGAGLRFRPRLGVSAVGVRIVGANSESNFTLTGNDRSVSYLRKTVEGARGVLGRSGESVQDSDLSLYSC